MIGQPQATSSSTHRRGPLLTPDYLIARGLPRPEYLQLSTVTRVLKRAIACNDHYRSHFRNEVSDITQALEYVCQNAWLHEEGT